MVAEIETYFVYSDVRNLMLLLQQVIIVIFFFLPTRKEYGIW